MKVNYGIHIGNTSASIAKMVNGKPCIIRSNTLKDTMPVCVAINRRGAIQVGAAAFNLLENERLRALNYGDVNKNVFTEFTRTLGSDAVYHSSNANKAFTSIELLAEVIKTLCSFEKGAQIQATVITVPDSFKKNQINAVREAGMLAGLQQVEIIQKSIAASLAYGIDSIKTDGFWLVFDFGERTFKSALLKTEYGIMKVLDAEGDNYLGGINLDFATVDEIIIPYLQENYVIDELLRDNNKANILRNAMKFYAEEVKKKLSYSPEQEASILTNIGDLPCEDDEGELFELDITVTEAEVEKAIKPIFQKAIDISNELLDRNNLNGSNLSALILVGGPTHSPIIQRMLTEQICKPDTSMDPRTVIAKGAALYASKIDISEEAKEQTRDKTKIQLEIANESSTTEIEEFVPIKILEEKTEGKIPEKVFAEITRGDGVWSSGKVEIDIIGEVIEVVLIEGKRNEFEVSLFDENGKRLECEPNNFSIIQEEISRTATLPYNIGTEIKDKTTGKIIFRTIQGLEKSKSLPAFGTIIFKTKEDIRPGIKEDTIEIPIYQGGYNCEGSLVIHNHHVNSILITGSDLPSLLPGNSEVEIELNIDINQKITGRATFLDLAYTYEFDCITEIERLFPDGTIHQPRNIQSEDYIIKSKKITKAKVEDLLFRLTEKGCIPAEKFKMLYDKLFEMNDPETGLIGLHKEIKTYEPTA